MSKFERQGAILRLVNERKLATQNSAEIRDSVEEGKRRMARMIEAADELPAAA